MAQQRIGRYSILQDIASGTQGAVYRAFDPESGRIVALKVLHPSLAGDRNYLERFHREATITSSIDHPNVVKIHEVGEADGRHFIAMEFLPESLVHVIESAGRLPVQAAVSFAVQIADGLAAAHARGVVHRDVKPQNVLLAPDGTAKVTDFGIARGESLATMTATGMMMGTPYYMSPEQCRGERADARSDVYALGVVLFQMLAGEVPFDAPTPLVVLRKHVEEAPRPLPELRVDVPAPLADIVARALEKDPERRFGTAIEMAGALRRAMAADASGRERVPEMAPASPSESTSRREHPARAAEPGEQKAPPRQRAVATPPPRAPRPVSPRGSRVPWILLAVVVVAAIAVSVNFALGDRGKTVEREVPILVDREVMATRLVEAPVTVLVEKEVPVQVFETVVVERQVEVPVQVVETVVVERRIEVPLRVIETVVVEMPVEVEKRVVETVVVEKEVPMRVVETVIVERVVVATPTPVGTPAPEPVGFGPVSGRLIHDPDSNTIKTYSAGVYVSDFAAEATFFNPVAPWLQSWDYGFIFRRSGSAMFDILILTSGEYWYHRARTGTDTREGGQDALISQGVFSWDGPFSGAQGASNHLKLVVQGGSGKFYVGGTLIDTLTLDQYSAGDVQVMTGYFSNDQWQGGVTRFEDFTVTPLR